MQNFLMLDELITLNDKTQDFIITKRKDQYGYDAYEVHISTGPFNTNGYQNLCINTKPRSETKCYH